ncbi:hypothetical protein ACEUAP_20855 [Aeromonas veronii]|nr:hypothetical protein [Aeromonas hydrophila]
MAPSTKQVVLEVTDSMVAMEAEVVEVHQGLVTVLAAREVMEKHISVVWH